MPAVRRALVLAIAAVVVAPGAARAAPVTLAKLGDFTSPVYVTAPLGDASRVFVVEQGGTVKLVKGGVTSTFLDLTPSVLSGGERGLLSIAFPPDYATSGLFYVYYTAAPDRADHDRRAPRDAANPDIADASYARALVAIPHDRQSNHNGGQLQFGPDGTLYVGTGDGGSGGDPSRNCRTRRSRRWARCCSDQSRLPPGQAAARRPGVNEPCRIESSPRPAQPVALLLRSQHRRPRHRRRRPGRARGGRLRRGAAAPARAPTSAGTPARGATRTRAAWRRAVRRRGRRCRSSSTPHSPACSITGGYVVRDPALPELAGSYFYGDNCTGDLTGATLPAGATARAGPQRPGRVVLRRGRLGAYVASLGGPGLPLRQQRRVRRAGAFVGVLPAGVAAGRPAAARLPSRSCAPPRASMRCAPASSPSASAATSCAR